MAGSFPLRRYALQERLGEGATAVVYAARDQELQRDVAIKILREAVGMSDVARERFRREAQSAAGLSHPNLVAVYDAGSVEGQSYLVMERVKGKSLDDVLRERRPDEREIARILERAARGVAAAHERGIVHRDLKPANILISTSGEPKVSDFGMAHLMDSRMELTRTGVPLGTPLYMAPEQVQGQHDITPRTDVYGLGAILYEMLSGRPPHAADSILDLYGKIAREEPVRPRRWRPTVPPELEAIALKALDKEPARRYATAGLFADDLARFLEGKPVEARPASFAYRSYRRLKRQGVPMTVGALTLLAVVGVALVGQLRARAVEQERLRDRQAADERLRRASRESGESSRRREEPFKRLSNLWGRMVAILEWRQQASRTPIEIRQELERLLHEVSTYIADYPDLPQGYYVRARARHSAGDYSSAESDLTRALDRQPDFSPGWALMAQVKLERYVDRLYAWSIPERARRKKEAEPILREAEAALRRCEGGAPGKATSERWGLSWTRADIVNETMILALKERYIEQKLEAAKVRLQEAQANSPAAEYCDFLGNWAGEAKLAIPWMDQAISLSPNWSRSYVDRSNVWHVLGERTKAIEDLTRAIEIKPNYAMAYDHRGYYQCQLNNLEEAIQDCSRALELDPTLASAFVHRAEARRLKLELTKAVQDCSDALALSPDMPGAWSVRGHSRLMLGELDRAQSDLTKAIQLDPGEAWFYLQRANVHATRGDVLRMIKDCEKSLEISSPEWQGRIHAQKLLEDAKRR